MRFTEEQLTNIENAYEELLIIMREQEEEYGEMDFHNALEEVVYIHDLDDDMEKEVVDMYDSEDSPFHA